MQAAWTYRKVKCSLRVAVFAKCVLRRKMVAIDFMDGVSHCMFPPPREGIVLDQVHVYTLLPSQPHRPHLLGSFRGEIPHLVNTGSQAKPRWGWLDPQGLIHPIQAFEYAPQCLCIFVFIVAGAGAFRVWRVCAYRFCHYEHYITSGERLGRDRRGVDATGFNSWASIPRLNQVRPLSICNLFVSHVQAAISMRLYTANRFKSCTTYIAVCDAWCVLADNLAR